MRRRPARVAEADQVLASAERVLADQVVRLRALEVGHEQRESRVGAGHVGPVRRGLGRQGDRLGGERRIARHQVPGAGRQAGENTQIRRKARERAEQLADEAAPAQNARPNPPEDGVVFC